MPNLIFPVWYTYNIYGEGLKKIFYEFERLKNNFWFGD